MSHLVMGKNSVEEVIKNKPDVIEQIYTSLKREDPLVQIILSNKIPCQFSDKRFLDSLVKSESHQNIVAKIKSRNYMDVNEFIKKNENASSSVVLMLDSIFDPQNMGSILRAAECFKVDCVVFSKIRGTDITPVVTKAASGGTELVNIVKVSNLATTLENFKDSGYWSIACAISKDAKSLYDFKFTHKSVIILGSEGEGIQKLILKKADDIVYIPMLGSIDSLNVSQAAAVFLAQLRSKGF